MGSWKCGICDETGNDLGSLVKVGSTKFHVKCFTDDVQKAGVENYLREQEEIKTAKAQAEKEQADARALALKNQEAEKQRIAALTQAEREKLKKAAQGESRDRFELIELGDEVQAPKTTTTQRPIDRCVRCNSELTSSEKAYHPRHCSKCWMDESTGQDAKLSKQNLEETLKKGLRPIEID